MIRLLILGCRSKEIASRIIQSVCEIQGLGAISFEFIAVPPVPSEIIDRSIVLQLEPETTIKKIVASFDNNRILGISEAELKRIKAVLWHQKSKYILQEKGWQSKRNQSIPAQCKVAARMQTTWNRRK